MTGLCLPCPLSATCINGAPPLFGASKLVGTIETELPDNQENLQDYLAAKFGVEAWQLTVLPQQEHQRRGVAAVLEWDEVSYSSPPHFSGSRATNGAISMTRRTPFTEDTFETRTLHSRGSAIISFELVADIAQMAKLITVFTALGVELSRTELVNVQRSESEEWDLIDGSYLLRRCSAGQFRLLLTLIVILCFACA